MHQYIHQTWSGIAWRPCRLGGILVALMWLMWVAPAGAVDTAAVHQVTSIGPVDPYVSPTTGLGSWIWSSKTYDGQVCQMWRTFEIPATAKVTSARLAMTVDNEFTLYLDGRELGQGAEWRELFIFDLKPLLTPGKHVLAVKAINSFGFAGMLFGLQIALADGRTIDIRSDKSWRVVPDGGSRWEKKLEPAVGWPATVIVSPLGGNPWWVQPVQVNKMPTLQPVKVFFWQTGWFQITLLCVSAIVIFISLRLTAQLTMHRKERLLLQQERARIARDIHDDIGARMTQLVLHGEVAQSELIEGSEAQSHLAQICEEARGLLSTMDEILWAVNPKRDTVRDFAAYVCNYAQKFLKPTPIQCLFELDPEMTAANFNLPLRRSLLMAIKEILNNAVKHSGATELRLQIQWQGEQLIVVVQDNGRGFDPKVVKSTRHGMTNMAQRLSELGGTCLVTSQPGQGCRIELRIQLENPRRNLWYWLWHACEFPVLSRETRNARAEEPSKNHDPTQC